MQQGRFLDDPMQISCVKREAAGADEFAVLLQQLERPIESDAFTDYTAFMKQIGSPDYLRRCGLIKH